MFMTSIQSRNIVGGLLSEKTHTTKGLYFWLTDTIHLNIKIEWPNKQYLSLFLFCQCQDPLTWHVDFIIEWLFFLCVIKSVPLSGQ